jgi:D-glycero-D-manno-heptose 1,7-bisphosphate phosphatase
MTSPFTGIACVFLDRDGVINRKAPEGSYIAGWGDFHILPGAEAAIAALHRAGLRVIVVSNQRGIALGRYTAADVNALHDALQQHLQSHGARIDAFYFCPHDKNECDCRKPRPGLFLEAFRDFPEVSAANSLLIGDSLSDIEAARNLGMRSIFIHGDPATRKAGAEKAATLADASANSLAAAIEFLPLPA